MTNKCSECGLEIKDKCPDCGKELNKENIICGIGIIPKNHCYNCWRKK